METRRASRRTSPAAPLRTQPRRAQRRPPAPQGATLAACERIWTVIARIPPGTVATYGGVAASAGMPGRARFVVYALKAAPAARALPWHRVLGAGGRIAFPAGSRAHREQRRRLLAEGLRVERGRVVRAAARGPATLDALLWGAPR